MSIFIFDCYLYPHILAFCVILLKNFTYLETFLRESPGSLAYLIAATLRWITNIQIIYLEIPKFLSGILIFFPLNLLYNKSVIPYMYNTGIIP